MGGGVLAAWSSLVGPSSRKEGELFQCIMGRVPVHHDIGDSL